MVNLKNMGVELAEATEPLEGQTYEIVKTEEVKTAVQGYNGIRVVMKNTNKSDETEYATMLWTRERAGVNSKLGAFIAAFKDFFGDEDDAYETNNWVGHTIRFISWQPRKREIRVIS